MKKDSNDIVTLTFRKQGTPNKLDTQEICYVLTSNWLISLNIS